MSEYIPDKWVVVKIGDANVYKVFASWYGGYAGSDSWKLNSGITKATLINNHYEIAHYDFEGSSGSVYRCAASLYGTNLYGSGALSNMIETAAKHGVTIKILPEDTNWENITYE